MSLIGVDISYNSFCFFFSMTGRLGAIAAQFINGYLEKRVSALLLVTSSCMILGGGFVFFLPDDRTGHSLTDTRARTAVEKVTEPPWILLRILAMR